MGWRAAVLLAMAPTVRSTFGGACSNNSYILPLSRRRIAPSASALESFQQKIIALARNASALEIGGPTTNIGGLYAQLAWASVDIVNWSEQDGAVTRVETVGAEASSGSAFYVDDRLLGRLRVGDGGRLEHVADGSYDVVMAFHVLEHFADPLRALATWRRVLKPGGYLVVSVPWAENTYDREVPVSTIYDLILAHADAADSSDDPEVLRRLERRVRAYHRLVDLDIVRYCSPTNGASSLSPEAFAAYLQEPWYQILTQWEEMEIDDDDDIDASGNTAEVEVLVRRDPADSFSVVSFQMSRHDARWLVDGLGITE